ncbi:BLI-3 blue-light-inducible Bli-3 protein [Pseudocyphellaria aurata]|nr:BLI-3 blue-light-inducible Bli-3 protein [Pseudocyphellaria aurata]
MSFSNTDTGDKTADPYKAKNLDEPPLKEKVEALSTFISNSKFGMLTTRIEGSKLLTSRAMSVAAQETGGIDLIFHTNTESGKTDDIEADNEVNVSFLNSTGEWASVSGEATVVTDRDVVRKYYNASLKAWVGDLGDGVHDGGPEDPRIAVIRVLARTATYALAVGTSLGRAAEIVKGAVTGQAAQVNKLRELTEKELDEWRKVSS